MAMRQDAGVGADRGELAELGDRPVEDLAQLLPLAHVSSGCDAPAPVALDKRLRPHEVVPGGHRVGVRLDVLTDVDGDDVGAFVGLGVPREPGPDRDRRPVMNETLPSMRPAICHPLWVQCSGVISS